MNRNIKKKYNALVYETLSNAVDKKFNSVVTDIKDNDLYLMGVSITTLNGEEVIEFWSRYGRLIYPFREFDDGPEWNIVVNKINKSKIPDLTDIIELVSQVQKYIPDDTQLNKNRLTMMRNFKIVLQSRPYILFSRSRLIKDMTDEERVDECVVLHSNYPNLGIDKTYMQVYMSMDDNQDKIISILNAGHKGIQ